MVTTSAQDLADALYSLGEQEFFRPRDRSPARRALVRLYIGRAQDLPAETFRAFSRELIQAVSSYCEDSTRNPGALYRAFDGIDEVLKINYRETRQMMPATGTERLYEGGGVGVQTSYATIFKILPYLKLPEGSHLIDLGSGYGRVGLATGLWREDLCFSGYEYVGHRVSSANASAERAGLGARIKFLEQDLSAPDFQIPAADVYYLFDPFSDSTYHHVFARLAELGRQRKTTIIVKDGARENFQRWMRGDGWHAPEALDEGSILLFHSR